MNQRSNAVAAARSGLPVVAPGPRGNPLLGNLLAMQRMDMLQFYTQHWRQYGDVVRFRMGPLVQHLVVQPDHVKHVLATNSDNYTKGIGMAKLKMLLGNGLFTSEGAFWQQQRRIMQPPFTHKGVARLADDMTAITSAMLDHWQTLATYRHTVDVSFEMMRLALNIIAKTTLDIDANQMASTTYHAFTDALEFILARTVTLLDVPLFVPTAQNRRFNAAIATLDRIIYGIIAERRRRQSNKSDMLSMLLQARDEQTGQEMTEGQLRDEVMTIFFAGHETTALTLTWIWYLLAQHPEVETKLYAELDYVLHGRTPTLEDAPKLVYTRMVIEEAMRLYPPAAMFVRDATDADTIGEYEIPKRSMLVFSPYLTHRHPAFWTDPERFDPERFAPEQLKRHPYAYIPFGAGPRKCIGNHFALLENQLVLAMVVQRFRLQLAPNQHTRPHFGGTLRPASNLVMRLEQRHR